MTHAQDFSQMVEANKCIKDRKMENEFLNIENRSKIF